MLERRNRFPEMLHTIDELTRQVTDIVLQCQPADSVQLIIMIPAAAYPVRRSVLGLHLPFGWRRTPERVLVFGRDFFMMIDNNQEAPPTYTCIPLAALIELHHFRVLLYSWIEFNWEDAGEVKTVRAEYNSVGSRMIEQGITVIRETFPRQSRRDKGIGAVNLANFPFKFRSYLYSSAMDGEPLVGAVFQPAIRPRGRRWGRYLSPNRVVALTDRNIILVEDRHDRIGWGRKAEADYAVSQRYFPLVHVQSVDRQPSSDHEEIILRFGKSTPVHDVHIALMTSQAQDVFELLHEDVHAA